MSGATAQDFKNWTAKAKKATGSELEYIIADCRSAREAMKGWNPEKENYYADQGMTFSDELRKRGQGYGQARHNDRSNIYNYIGNWSD